MADKNNHAYVQVRGPMLKDEELLDKIKVEILLTIEQLNSLYIEHIGIQTSHGHFCEINGEQFEIGKTGILEIRDTNITSFKFSQNEDEGTIVDCFLAW